MLSLARLGTTIRSTPRQSKTLGHAEEDVNAAVHAAKALLARPHGENRHVSQRVHALIVADRQRAVEQDAARAIRRVGIVIVGARGSSSSSSSRRRYARAVLVDRPVLAAVWAGHEALEEGVARVPVGGEVAVGVGEVARVDVLAEAGLLVDADGVALAAVGGLGGEVVCVDGAHDVEAVAVVSGDEEEGFVERVGGVEVGDGRFDSIVKFEQFAEGAVVVERVHHLILRKGWLVRW